MNEFKKIPCVIQRGGTSKGVYLHDKDLPKDQEIRKNVILSIFGSPDKRQIDGLGGADPLTSKVAIISPSTRMDANIDYTFGAVDIYQPIIDFGGNCGNISSGVGPFAIDEGLIKCTENPTCIKIFNTNTKKILKAYVPTENGKTKYTGNFRIDGVPGTGSKILLDYSETVGTITGNLLPTGNLIDSVSIPSIGTFEMTIVDVANPVCFINPEVLNLSGIEGPKDHNILQLLDKIEIIRGFAAQKLGLVQNIHDAKNKTPSIPLLVIASKKKDYKNYLNGEKITAKNIDFVSRVFYMQEMHKAHSATAAICTAVSAMMEGTVANRIMEEKTGEQRTIRIGHPSGIINVEIEMKRRKNNYELQRAAMGRTSKRIMEGHVLVPEIIFKTN